MIKWICELICPALWYVNLIVDVEIGQERERLVALVVADRDIAD